MRTANGGAGFEKISFHQVREGLEKGFFLSCLNCTKHIMSV